jgi:hypothetical protein
MNQSLFVRITLCKGIKVFENPVIVRTPAPQTLPIFLVDTFISKI